MRALQSDIALDDDTERHTLLGIKQRVCTLLLALPDATQAKRGELK